MAVTVTVTGSCNANNSDNDCGSGSNSVCSSVSGVGSCNDIRGVTVIATVTAILTVTMKYMHMNS